MQDYKKLLVYREAYDSTKEIYTLTKHWPQEELYNLTTQIRRSAHSVDSNICEGVSRDTTPDTIRFLYHAYASVKETENHLKLAFELGYVNETNYNRLNDRLDYVGRMLNNFILYKKSKTHPCISAPPQPPKPL